MGDPKLLPAAEEALQLPRLGQRYTVQNSHSGVMLTKVFEWRALCSAATALFVLPEQLQDLQKLWSIYSCKQHERLLWKEADIE